LQQEHLVAADQAQVLLAVAVEIDDADRLGLRIDPAHRRDVREALHAHEAAEVLAAPAEEVALRIVIQQFEADLEALDLGPAIVQVFLVAVDHARGGDLLALQHLIDDAGEFVGVAAEAAQQERLGVAVVPPFAAGVGLIPPGADAGLRRAALIEEDGRLARLRPVHLRLPLVGAQAAAADVVLDDVGRVLALDVADLAVDDEVLVPVERFDAHEDDVRRLLHDGAKAHRRLDVSAARAGQP
jgi:hypothetical protein